MRIIAGPCQHESLAQSSKIARECKRVCDFYNIDYVFKASFDKANRTSVNGERGVGFKKTMEDFRELIGSTNPADAKKGTIRNLYATSMGENAVHGSDSNENAKIEGTFHFSDSEILS